MQRSSALHSTATGTQNSGWALQKVSPSGAPIPARGDDLWGGGPGVIVHGDSLRTWSFSKPKSPSQQVVLKTEGRPLNADVQLWIGPDWTPYDMKIYSEDGLVRPLRTKIGTKKATNTLAVRNNSAMEFPLAASCGEAPPNESLEAITQKISAANTPKKVEGGAVYTAPFEPDVDRVQVLLKTNGMKLNARIELLQGPNNIKQAIEVHTNDGLNRPFYALLESPGSGNVVRIVNLATLEFPLSAYIVEG